MRTTLKTNVTNNIYPILENMVFSLFTPTIASYLQYFVRLRRIPNLSCPKSLTEKIQYRKLHDRDPRIPYLVDKISVKDFIRTTLGDSWIIPTLWSGKTLPSLSERSWKPPYVIKANHGSGWNIFIYDNTPINWDLIEVTCEKWMSSQYRPHSGQWAYSRIEPSLLIEKYVGSTQCLPIDYKFFVFSGKVQFIQVDTDRKNQHKRVFFDKYWRRQPFTIAFPADCREISPPASLEMMIWAAELLSSGFSFVRVDFYEIAGQPKFGEMTFYPESGLFRVSPVEWDLKLGELWQL